MESNFEFLKRLNKKTKDLTEEYKRECAVLKEKYDKDLKALSVKFEEEYEKLVSDMN